MLAIVNVSFPFAWISPTFSARVVDDASGSAISGAIVVVTWELAGTWSGYPIKQLAVIEVITGKDGRFTIPGWGPRFYLGWGNVPRSQPIARVYHPAYRPWVRNNSQLSAPTGGGVSGPFLEPYLRGQDVRLERLTGQTADEEAMGELVKSMYFVYGRTDCAWKRVPHLVMALERVRQSRGGLPVGWFLIAISDLGPTDKCGNAAEFLQGYKK